MSDKTYVQEFDQNDGNHRIVCSDGRKTHWTPYTGYAYMDGLVSCTGYYMGKEGLHSAHDFLANTAYSLAEGERT